MKAGSEPDRAPEGIAIAHDYLLVMRGAERTFAAIADLYPEAPILTLLYDEEATDGRFAGRTIHTSPLQRLPIDQGSFRRLLPLYPWAAERLRADGTGILLTSSSAFGQGIRAPEGTVHVCYSHTPFRYAWYEQERALSEVPAPLRPALALQLRWMRRWDRRASTRVDHYIANSELTRERLRHCYGRDSVVVHPPVETERFRLGSPGTSLLVVSEVVRHKRVHVALEGARRAGLPIQVVGTGPDLAALSQAYPEAEFLGRMSDADLVGLYADAFAVVVPSREEFGITAVEAQAAGRPVVAAAAGGALETVVDGETGCLATLDDADSFAAAMRRVDSISFEPERALAQARRFSVDEFRRRLSAEVLKFSAV
jgi:glycosyltransferase involved in cell wall biosynthesis